MKFLITFLDQLSNYEFLTETLCHGFIWSPYTISY